MGILKILLFLFTPILFIQIVLSIPQVDISVKSNFYSGDQIHFSYRFVSTQDETLKYFASVSCPDSKQALLEEKTAQLKSNISFFGNYSFGKVDDSFVDASCKASITILEPYLITQSEEFSIKVNLSSFSVKIKICGDSSCQTPKKIFIRGEDIYLDYDSSVENSSIGAILTYPDGTKKDIQLPYSFQAEQIGTYYLDVSASKAGYKNVSAREMFGVIEKPAEISGYAVDSAENNNTSSDENKASINEQKISRETIVLAVIIVISIVILIVIILIIYNFIKARRQEPFGAIRFAPQ